VACCCEYDEPKGPVNVGNSCLAEQLLASDEGLCSMELQDGFSLSSETVNAIYAWCIMVH